MKVRTVFVKVHMYKTKSLQAIHIMACIRKANEIVARLYIEETTQHKT